MVITFCGHGDFVSRAGDEERMLTILEGLGGGEACDFLLGNYGGFDRFAHGCARRYRARHPGTRLILVQPYPTLEHCRRHGSNTEQFDFSVYPGMEGVPNRLAIRYRNRWMVEQADAVVAYITHNYGGAYATYRYAMQRRKPICRLSSPAAEPEICPRP